RRRGWSGRHLGRGGVRRLASAATDVHDLLTRRLRIGCCFTRRARRARLVAGVTPLTLDVLLEPRLIGRTLRGRVRAHSGFPPFLCFLPFPSFLPSRLPTFRRRLPSFGRRPPTFCHARVTDGENHLSDLDLVSRFHLDLADGAGVRRGNFDGSLARCEIEDRP